MRCPTLTNKDPTVILASVALARLMVYANHKSVKDHRNPKQSDIFDYQSMLDNKEGHEGQRTQAPLKIKKNVSFKNIKLIHLLELRLQMHIVTSAN